MGKGTVTAETTSPDERVSPVITLPSFDFEVQENIYGNLSAVEEIITDVGREILITDDGNILITGIEFKE